MNITIDYGRVLKYIINVSFFVSFSVSSIQKAKNWESHKSVVSCFFNVAQTETPVSPAKRAHH